MGWNVLKFYCKGDDMNTKGFTLLELISVLVILVAIVLVSFPSFLSMAKTADNQKYDTMIENLCKAGESYIYTHKEQYDELLVPDGIININVSELVKDNQIDKGIINPKTEKDIYNDTLTFKMLSDSSLECTYNG